MTVTNVRRIGSGDLSNRKETTMFSRTLTFSTIVAGLLVLNIGPASAGLPTGFVNGLDCKGFHHSKTAKAKKQSKAKQRARGKWESLARKTYGWSYRKWSKAKFKHYDCTKPGGWWHCKAAAYPCK